MLDCAANGISIISPHTALDSVNNGVNDWLASGLGSGILSAIKPINSSEEISLGLGRILTLDVPVSLDSMIIKIKQFLGLKYVRVAKSNSNTIQTIALCAGSGGSVLSKTEADLYLTGEMSHHDVLEAVSRNTNVILCEHSNTERGYLSSKLLPFLQQHLKSEGISANVICSVQDRDPLEIQ